MKKGRNQARLRLVTVDGLVVARSGHNSSRGNPEIRSSSRMRSTSRGRPDLRHLWIACGVMPNARANAPTPPEHRMTLSTKVVAMPLSQPQVENLVNLPLLVPLNPRFHAYVMTALGRTIKSRLKALGKTQAWLAEQVGVSENAVSKWIKTGKISRENLKRTADALEISVAQLLDPHPVPELDERWHSFPPSLKRRVLDLVDELTAKRRA